MTTEVNPYVGPRALESGEALFGRDDETVDLLNRVIADRVVLLYAVSGAGKTSLLKAGLLPGLEARGFAPLPIVQVRDEPPAGFAGNRYTLSVIGRLETARPAGGGDPVPDPGGLTLEAYLAARFPGGLAGRVLVFDQFEDVLRIDPTDADVKEAFFRDVGQVLRKDGVRAVFSLREEYAPGLDPYLKYLPTRLASRFRLALLSARRRAGGDPSPAEEAVAGPAAGADRPFAPDVVAAVVGELRKVNVQQADGSVAEREGAEVEPVQLQVVCQLLWDRVPAGTGPIGPEVLTGFSVGQALEQYYAARVAAAARAAGVREELVRRWVEDKLITAQRLRGQVRRDVGATDGLPDAAVEGLVGAYLVRSEPRLGGTWLELTHDRLVDPIRQSNRAWFALRLQPFQAQADQWAARADADKGKLLLKGVALADAEQWLAAHPGEARPVDEPFLAASRGARTAGDRVRTAFYRGWAAISTLALVAGLVLVWWALEERWAANRAREQAVTAQLETNEANGRLVRRIVDMQTDISESLIRAANATVQKNLTEQALLNHQTLYHRLIDVLAVQSSKLATATDRETIILAGSAWEVLYTLWPDANARPDVYNQLTAYVRGLREGKAVPDLTKQEGLSLALSRAMAGLFKQQAKTSKDVIQSLTTKYHLEALLVTVTLANPDTPDRDRRQARADFEQLYWVKLALFEGLAVSKAMAEFRQALPNDDTHGFAPAVMKELFDRHQRLHKACQQDGVELPGVATP